MAFQRLIFTAFILVLLVMSLSPQDFTINSVEGEVSYSQDVAWESTYGKNYTETLYDMIQTVDGGFALVGCAVPDVGGIYTYLVKTYANGSVEWTQNYSIGTDTYGASLIQTFDGGYAIAGWIISGNRDSFLIKTDENGTALWTKTYSSGPIDYASSLVQTVDGGYALGGYTATQSLSDADGWLVKTDANGNLQWSQKYGGTREEEIYAIVQTGDGGYALAGRTMSYASGFYDYWLVKTNSAGVFQWNKTYGGGGQDAACSLIQTGDGGFALAGYVDWPGDAMVVKTDVNGAVEWSKQYGSADLEVGGSLDRRREGGYAMAIQSGTKLLFLELNSDGSIQSQARYPTTQQFVRVSGGVVVQIDDGGYAIAGSAEISSYPYDSDFYLLKTSGKDTDQDGLFDLWEQQGIDVNNDGNLELDLKSLGADWQYKDLFVEVDYMANHKPNVTAIKDVENSFRNAPVLNPNGTSGINLHVIVDNEIAHLDSIKVGNESWGDFDTFKWGNFGNPADRANDNWLYIKEARHRVFRYCLFIHNYDGSTSSGLAECPGNDFLVSLGSWTEIGGHKVGSRDEQAGTFMHELGHTLGLDHGGGDDVNGKPNYISIMSYSRQMPYRVPTKLLDYSRAKLPSLNESNLDENLGVQDPANVTTIFGPPVQDELTRKWIAPYYPSLGPIDWNQNGASNDTGLAISINNFTMWEYGDAELTVLEGYDDWANIKLNFRDAEDYAEGVHVNVADPEMTWEVATAMRDETEVIPEFPPAIMLAALVTLTLAVSLAFRRKAKP